MATPEQILDPSSGSGSPSTERALMNLWQTIGAAKVVNQIVASLASQSIHAIERIRDDKLYLAAGYETFREFLDDHPESPMTYDQFNRRVKLLDSEGDTIFDLLSSLNVPLKERKLLAGQISVEGDEIEIAGARTRLDDHIGVLNLITAQHAKLQEQQRTIERGKKDVDNQKRLTIEAEKRAVIANPTGTLTGQALLTASGALSHLRDVLAGASDDEKQAFREPVFELLRVNQLECSVALGILSEADVRAAATAEGDDEFADDDSLGD